MRNTNTISGLLSGLARLQVLALALMFLAVGSAANGQQVSFQIGENAAVLRASLDLDAGLISQAEFDQILMVETCHNPASRLQDRNRPYLSVLNNSANASDEITTVVLNMQEAGFVFGDGDMAGDGFEGLLSMLSTQSDDGVELASAMYLGDESELQLSFTGLTQGLAAIFRVDIDEPGGIFMFPDYREAFQGANEGIGRNGDLAQLSATFSSGATLGAVFPQVGVVVNAGIPERYHAQSITSRTTSMVPEPATFVMLASALVGTAAMRRRSR